MTFYLLNHSVAMKGNETCTLHQVLQDKHPHAKPAADNSLLHGSVDFINHIISEVIDGQAISNAALNVHEGTGPLGLTADGWRRLCCSFHSKSNNPCDALTAVARRLCTTFTDPKAVESLVGCHLIPLNKNPGVRPFCNGEVPHQIIAKAVIKVIRCDILNAVGSL